MAEGKKSATDWLWPIAMVGLLVALAAHHLFGTPDPPENSAKNITIRLEKQEAADAQSIGDNDSAAWWDRQAKREAARPQ